jgi:hypothetical protein
MCLSSLAQSKYLGKNENGLDIYKIDLSSPAKERFAEVSAAYSSGLKAFIEKYQPLIPGFVVTLFKTLDWCIWLYHSEKYDEILGMA